MASTDTFGEDSTGLNCTECECLLEALRDAEQQNAEKPRMKGSDWVFYLAEISTNWFWLSRLASNEYEYSNAGLTARSMCCSNIKS